MRTSGDYLPLNANPDDYLPAFLRIEPGPEGWLDAELSSCGLNTKVTGKFRLGNLIDSLKSHYGRLWVFFGTKKYENLTRVEEEENHQLRLANQLMKAVFVDRLKTGLDDLSTIAQTRTILLTLIAPNSELDMIPWELMGHSQLQYTRRKQLALAVCRACALSPHKQEHQSVEYAKIMLATSQPLDSPALHTDTEFSEIRQVVREHNSQVKVVSIDGPEIDYSAFISRLYMEQPSILHLSAHGTPTHLQFRKGNSHQAIPRDSLVRDIRQVKSLRLAVLNVCHSASPEDIGDIGEEIFVPGLSRRFVESGVPAAIGMATLITERAGCEFGHWLYSWLSLKYPVSVAYERAIDALRNDDKSDRLLWSVPMLYMSQDVIPLASVIDGILDEVTGQSTWPTEFLVRVGSTLRQFIAAIESIRPWYHWSGYEWRRAVRPVRVILPSLKELIGILPIQLPSAPPLELRDLAVNLRRHQRRAAQQLSVFESWLGKLETIGSSAAETASVIQGFAESSQETVAEMRELLSHLQG